MKLLLTSGSVTNTSIHDTLVDLLGKTIAESHALCIPTAQWGHPMCSPASVRGFIAAGTEFRYLSGLGWASLGVLELTALPTIGTERWVPWLREVDVLLVDGGDATYLCHWMRESGLADLLPSLPDAVVGSESLVSLQPNVAERDNWSAAEAAHRARGDRPHRGLQAAVWPAGIVSRLYGRNCVRGGLPAASGGSDEQSVGKESASATLSQ